MLTKKLLMLFTALASVASFSAQVLNWNPDYDGNGVIGTDDLLGVLMAFGFDATPVEGCPSMICSVTCCGNNQCPYYASSACSAVSLSTSNTGSCSPLRHVILPEEACNNQIMDVIFTTFGGSVVTGGSCRVFTIIDGIETVLWSAPSDFTSYGWSDPSAPLGTRFRYNGEFWELITSHSSVE